MAKGKKTGGRQKGTPNKNGIARIQKIIAGGTTPIEHMLEIMRSSNYPDPMRLDAARAVAPFIHPRLQTIQHQGNDGGALTVVIKKYGDE